MEKMSCLLAHRGPDNQGLWVSDGGNVVLAHRRLSIIDISDEAKQPMVSYDGRYMITYNGEIYNYSELRDNNAVFSLISYITKAHIPRKSFNPSTP